MERQAALGRLTHSRVLGILANPSYAGAYVFGRYQSSKQVRPSGEIATRSRPVAQDAWRVMIRDHHEGYIDWDGFVANRLRLAANRTNGEGLSGPAREGLCLLQGMLLCGVCGRRLGVRYTGNGGIYPVYQCIWKHREALAPGACLTVPATPLDQSVTERLVGAITPVTIELALAALTSLEDRDREIGAQWRMRIERARYEVDLAERRYEAVDPGNRWREESLVEAEAISQPAVYMAGAGFAALLAFPFFWVLKGRTTAAVWLAFVTAYNLGPTLMLSVQATFFTTLFEARVRYTGLSVAYQVSAIVGGFTPLISLMFLHQTDGAPWGVAAFLAAVALLSFSCAARVRSARP